MADAEEQQAEATVVAYRATMVPGQDALGVVDMAAPKANLIEANHQLGPEWQRAGRADPWGLNPPTPARTHGFEPTHVARAYPRSTPPRSDFCHNFSKNYPHYLKMV